MAASGLTFEEFASAHLDASLRFATALTNDRELGADLVQDVLLRAHERWAHVGSRADPVPYARRMIVNEFISWRRKWARVVPGVNLADETGPTGAPDHAERYADHLSLLHELERLPRRQRAVIVLRYYEDLPDDEIAQILGCTTSTVRGHAFRALRALRVELAAPGATRLSGAERRKP
jgi:RNA polymerase sigma-70 factor (sigma-E family)